MKKVTTALLAFGMMTSAVHATALEMLAQKSPESVYAPPELPRDDEGVNQGAVHFDLGLSYFSKYLFRGV